jgi:carbon monoxide dehydrogenase subunit G
MQMAGEQLVTASRQQVWDGLNDPDVLRQCIPGCQMLEKESPERMNGTVEIKIGPIGARFKGAVVLSDLDAPNSYTITGEGQGGTVGSAKGGATVRLRDHPNGTLLTYRVDAQVGGRLAQLGGPIIDATARRLAGTFFTKFGQVVGAPAAIAATAGPVSSGPTTRVAAPGLTRVTGFPVAWILALLCTALIGFLVGRGQGGAGSDWAGIAIGLLLALVAAAAFEFGRRNATPIIMLDATVLSRLAALSDGPRQ